MTAMLLYSFSLVLAVVFAIALFRKTIISQALIQEQKRIYKHKVWLTAAAGLALLTGIAIVNRRLDIILLGNLSVSAEVAYYALACLLYTSDAADE